MNNHDSQPFNTQDLSEMDTASSYEHSLLTNPTSTRSPSNAFSLAETDLYPTTSTVQDVPLKRKDNLESIVLETSASSLPPVPHQLVNYGDTYTPEIDVHGSKPMLTLAVDGSESTPTRIQKCSQLQTPPTSPTFSFTSNARNISDSITTDPMPSASQDSSIRLRPDSPSLSPEIDSAASEILHRLTIPSTSLTASNTVSQSTEQVAAWNTLPRPLEQVPDEQPNGEAVLDHGMQLDEHRTKRIRAMEEEEKRQAKKIKLDQLWSDERDEKRQKKRAREAESVANQSDEGWHESPSFSTFRERQLQGGTAQPEEYELEEGEVREYTAIEISLALFPIALYDIPPHLLPSAEQANLKSKIPETLELEPAPSKKPKKKKETGSEGEKKKTNIDRVSDNAYVREVQNVATEDNAHIVASPSESAAAHLLDLSELPASHLVRYLKGLDSSLEPLAPFLQASSVVSVDSLVEMASLDPSLRKRIYSEIVARGEGIDPSLFVLLESKLIAVSEQERKG